MRIIPVVLLLIAAGISTASAQRLSTDPGPPPSAEAPPPETAAAPAQAAPAPPTPETPAGPAFSMDHGQAAAAEATAKAEAEATKAKEAAIKAGTPLSPSQTTDFRINGGDVIRAAPPAAAGQQKAAEDARNAWQERCRPTVVTDREGLRRTRYAEADCDIGRVNTAKAQ